MLLLTPLVRFYIWALAKLGRHGSVELLAVIERCIVQAITEINAQQLAGMIWAVATLGGCQVLHACHGSGMMSFIGVRGMVARGYFISEGVSQRMNGYFHVARCQTWKILDLDQSPVVSHRDGF